jgi:integrase
MAQHRRFRKPVLTPEEQAEQDAIADSIIEEILREEGGRVIWIDLESKRPTDANIPNWVPWTQAQWAAWLTKSTQLVADLAALHAAGKLDERNALIDANSVHWGALKERLLAFMEKDKIYSKYYDEVVLLLETGLRISEFCGLTTHIDMQNRILNIDHQLLKDSEIGYYIETPKTKNGKRELPLTERAYQAIQRILKSRGKAQPLIVGGYSNFLFLNREGLPKVAGNYEGMVRGLIKKYNKYHTDKLPNITPHSFRHTYCTNMANRGMNPNTLQYLMGHANITMTLGYYAHGTFQSAKAELERLAC